MSHDIIRPAFLYATFATFLSLTFAAPPAEAGPAVWTRTGPLQGGTVTALAIDPTSPSTVYLGTRAEVPGGKVFRSVDGGETWTAVGPDRLRAVTRLAVHPRRGATVYAVALGLDGWALYRSRDAGVTWARLRTASDGMDFAIDPSRPSRLIAYDAYYCEPHCDDHSSTILESTDGGDTWAVVRRLRYFLETLEIDSLSPSTVYAVASNDGALGAVIKSTDGGRTWKGAGGGPLVIDAVLELAVDPGRSGTVYASTWNPGRFDGSDGIGLFKSVDGGASWRSIHGGLGRAVVTSLAFGPDGLLYAGAWGGVFVSANGGRTWRPAQSGLSSRRIEALAVDPLTPGVLYAGTAGDGAFKSVDGGARWRPKRRRIELPVVSSLAVGSGSPSVLFAGTAEGSGIYRSVDGGRSWQPVNHGLPEPRGGIVAVAVSPDDPTTVYAAPLGQGVYKSADSGSSWAAGNRGLDLEAAAYQTTIFDLAIDPRRTTTLYAATFNGVFKSTDGADSWRRAGTGLPRFAYTRAVAVDPRRPATVYAAIYQRVFRSDDGAASWAATRLTGAQEVYDLAIDSRTGAVYAGTAAGVFKSADGGLSWTSQGLAGNGGVKRLEIASGSLYAVVAYLGVFRSTDGGESWTVLDTGSPPSFVNAIAVVADGPVKVFAGFLTVAGVYEWEE